MKAFIIFSIVWYAFATIVNLLSFGIAVGEDSRNRYPCPYPFLRIPIFLAFGNMRINVGLKWT